jgi:four helix bundle protein
MRNFRELEIWKIGIQLTKLVYELCSFLPENEKYGIKSQIARSAVSIPSNIAEGASRSSENDFCRFLEIALGSAFELETQLIIIKEQKWTKEEIINNILELICSEQKMINSFQLAVRDRSKKPNTQNLTPNTL